MPSGVAALKSSRNVGERWLTAASKPSSPVSSSPLASDPATPTTRHPRCRASCPTRWPTEPLAAPTTTVSPAAGRPTSNRPKYAVSPFVPSSDRCSAGSTSHRPPARRAPASTAWSCQPVGAGDEVAGRDTGDVRHLDPPDPGPAHHHAGHRRAGVRRAALQPGTLPGADRQGQRAHQHLAVARRRHSVVAQLVVGRAAARHSGARRSGSGGSRSSVPILTSVVQDRRAPRRR